MLYVVVALLVVIAGIFIGLYLATNSAAAKYRQEAEQQEVKLTNERDELSDARDELKVDLNKAQTKIAGLDTKLTARNKEVKELKSDLADKESESDKQAAQIKTQLSEIADLTSEISSLHGKLTETEQALETAESLNTGMAIGDLVDIESDAPTALWDLEISRSERTWRNSVALNPASVSTPFEDAEDPVRLAVEVEAAALRENVGASIVIDWQTGLIEDPSRRHLVVRLAQEILEMAARNPEASRLVVSGDDDVNLRLEAVNEDEEVITVIPPRVTSDLVDVRGETGPSITVKS